MGDPLPPDPTITKLIGELDDLIAEAEKLRQHIDDVAHEPPVWPERRRVPRVPAQRPKSIRK